MTGTTIGSCGAAVSLLTLETMTFGAEADERLSGNMLLTFFAAGGTFIDTADVCSAGFSG